MLYLSMTCVPAVQEGLAEAEAVVVTEMVALPVPVTVSRNVPTGKMGRLIRLRLWLAVAV
jgi:hypothetical protein